MNHYWLPGSVIVFPNRYFMWNVLEADEIKPHTLELMNFVKPRPDYLIIGTGEINVNLDDTFYQHFKRMGIVVDTCPSVSFILCLRDCIYSLRRVLPSTCASRMTTMWRVLYWGPMSHRGETTLACHQRRHPTRWNLKPRPIITWFIERNIFTFLIIKIRFL